MTTEPDISSVRGGIGNRPQDERLDSWKEIARHFKREVRTVRRWEADEGLPVHRHFHKVRGSVYAFTSELDAWRAGRPERRSPAHVVLAVMPFENLGPIRLQDRSSEILTNEVVTQLARLETTKLRILDRRSFARLRKPAERMDKIAATLGATHMVVGTVYSKLKQIFVTTNLVKAVDQTHLWAESYTRGRSQVVHSEIGRLIAHSVVAKLVPVTPGTRHQRLSDTSLSEKAYLKGRFYWNKRTAEGLRKAIGCFEESLHENPRYAPAFAGLADCYVHLEFYGIIPSIHTMTKAKAAALRAVELDDGLGEGHASLAEVMAYLDWDMTGAEREFRLAIQLDPTYATAHHWYGDYLAITGRLEEALVRSRRALELDPTSPIINVWVGMKYYLAGSYSEALEQYKKTLEMHPNYALAHWALGLAYEQLGEYKLAIVERKRAVELSGQSPWMAAGLAYSNALSGNRTEAKRLLEPLRRQADQSSISYEITTVYAALGDQAEALRWLTRAFDHHSEWAPYMKIEPRLKCMWNNPGFQELVSRMPN
jgi:tetratricopeptide (TPR) repeat protein